MVHQWDHTLEFKHLLKCFLKKRWDYTYMKLKIHTLLQSLIQIVSGDGNSNIPLGSFCHRLKDHPFELYVCKFYTNKIDHCILMLISTKRFFKSKEIKTRPSSLQAQRLDDCLLNSIPHSFYWVSYLPNPSDGMTVHQLRASVFTFIEFCCLGFFKSYSNSSRWKVTLYFVLWMTRIGMNLAHWTMSLQRRIRAKVLVMIVTLYFLLFLDDLPSLACLPHFQ